MMQAGLQEKVLDTAVGFIGGPFYLTLLGGDDSEIEGFTRFKLDKSLFDISQTADLTGTTYSNNTQFTFDVATVAYTVYGFALYNAATGGERMISGVIIPTEEGQYPVVQKDYIPIFAAHQFNISVNTFTNV